MVLQQCRNVRVKLEAFSPSPLVQDRASMEPELKLPRLPSNEASIRGRGRDPRLIIGHCPEVDIHFISSVKL